MSNATPPIVLIHGLWLSRDCWRGWDERYRAAGHDVHVPPWPDGRDVGIADAVDHFEAVVRAQQEPPIIMGHSMGGLITQLLLDRGLGCAGVAIAPAKPRGVLRVPLSMWRSVMPVLRDPRNRKAMVALRAGQFHYAFANTVARAESDGWHAQLAVPAPGRVLFEAALADVTRRSKAATAIDFARPERAPLLFIAGGRDHLMPELVVYENFTRYRRSPAPADFKVFHDRPHLITVLDGWQAVADHALSWTTGHIR